jgi:hypothetical protein
MEMTGCWVWAEPCKAEDSVDRIASKAPTAILILIGVSWVRGGKRAGRAERLRRAETQHRVG